MKEYNGFSSEQRTKAQGWLNRQWRAGSLDKPTLCCACGQDKGVIDAHAEDYSEPFAKGKTDGFHLCFRCHMMVHCRDNNKDAWKRYKAALTAGITFEPFLTRNFGLFVSQTLKGIPPIDFTGLPRADVLGQIE